MLLFVLAVQIWLNRDLMLVLYHLPYLLLQEDQRALSHLVRLTLAKGLEVELILLHHLSFVPPFI